VQARTRQFERWERDLTDLATLLEDQLPRAVDGVGLLLTRLRRLHPGSPYWWSLESHWLRVTRNLPDFISSAQGISTLAHPSTGLAREDEIRRLYFAQREAVSEMADCLRPRILSMQPPPIPPAPLWAHPVWPSFWALRVTTHMPGV
jgi:hypothetical protein